MNPTPRLRYVEREMLFTVNESSGKTYAQTIRVLQQWYAYDINYPATKGEWRDVPLETERTNKTIF